MRKIGETDAIFYKEYGDLKRRHYFAHGRIEILGNHTDHNHGLALVGGSSLGITCACCPNDLGLVRLASFGFRPFEIHLDALEAKEEEKGSPLSLAKGVLFALKKLGYSIGGFFATCYSDIPSGSGVSSSACFESLIAEIINDIYNGGNIPQKEMAFACQYAEVVYFGKPCGLLDQIGSVYGGVNYVDFKNVDDPIVEPLPFPFPLKPVLILTPSSHDGLTPLYASISADMKSVAKNVFGKECLREVDPQEFQQRLATPTVGVSERAKLRATHFFDENRRVLDARRALLEQDEATFLRSVELSGESSRALLANTMVPGKYKDSPQEAVDITRRFLPDGKCRIMGGGFAGSILAFPLPKEMDGFLSSMRTIYGENNVIEDCFLEGGAKRIDEE